MPPSAACDQLQGARDRRRTSRLGVKPPWTSRVPGASSMYACSADQMLASGRLWAGLGDVERLVRRQRVCPWVDRVVPDPAQVVAECRRSRRYSTCGVPGSSTACIMQTSGEPGTSSHSPQSIFSQRSRSTSGQSLSQVSTGRPMRRLRGCCACSVGEPYRLPRAHEPGEALHHVHLDVAVEEEVAAELYASAASAACFGAGPSSISGGSSRTGGASSRRTNDSAGPMLRMSMGSFGELPALPCRWKLCQPMPRSRLKTYQRIFWPARATIVGRVPDERPPVEAEARDPRAVLGDGVGHRARRPAHLAAGPHLHLGRIEAHVHRVGVDDRDRHLLRLARGHDDLALHLLMELAVVRVRASAPNGTSNGGAAGERRPLLKAGVPRPAPSCGRTSARAGSRRRGAAGMARSRAGPIPRGTSGGPVLEVAIVRASIAVSRGRCCRSVPVMPPCAT